MGHTIILKLLLPDLHGTQETSQSSVLTGKHGHWMWDVDAQHGHGHGIRCGCVTWEKYRCVPHK